MKQSLQKFHRLKTSLILKMISKLGCSAMFSLATQLVRRVPFYIKELQDLWAMGSYHCRNRCLICNYMFIITLAQPLWDCAFWKKTSLWTEFPSSLEKLNSEMNAPSKLQSGEQFVPWKAALSSYLVTIWNMIVRARPAMDRAQPMLDNTSRDLGYW